MAMERADPPTRLLQVIVGQMEDDFQGMDEIELEMAAYVRFRLLLIDRAERYSDYIYLLHPIEGVEASQEILDRFGEREN